MALQVGWCGGNLHAYHLVDWMILVETLGHVKFLVWQSGIFTVVWVGWCGGCLHACHLVDRMVLIRDLGPCKSFAVPWPGGTAVVVWVGPGRGWRGLCACHLVDWFWLQDSQPCGWNLFPCAFRSLLFSPSLSLFRGELKVGKARRSYLNYSDEGLQSCEWFPVLHQFFFYLLVLTYAICVF